MTGESRVFTTLGEAAIIIFSRWPIIAALRYDRPMSDSPDLRQLAGRYLDLWQEQLASLVGDPAFADLVAGGST